MLVQWPEPSATDESGQVILVQRSHAPGAMFSVGSTTVTYRFSDNANNVADCVFVVTVVTGKNTLHQDIVMILFAFHYLLCM